MFRDGCRLIDPAIAMQLSVIIATRNRAHSLPACLTAIGAAIVHAAPIDAEIVIVDNGSTDDTKAVIEAWAAENSIPLQLFYEPRPGAARARNRGLRAARGQVFAVTDDDCLMSKDYVRQLLACDAADSGLVLRGGHVALGDPTDLPLTVTTPRLTRWNRRTHSARCENLGDYGLSCNMTFRRDLIDRIGFFDENLGAGTVFHGGEDSDFIFRAYLADATIETVPDMSVAHYHGRKTPAEGFRLLSGYMTGSGALYVKYMLSAPNFCRPFYWDCKSAVKEIITGTNTFHPNLGFSHKHKILYNLYGAIKYVARPFFVSLPMLRRIEAGNPGVSIGMYLAALLILWLGRGIGDLALIENDPLGLTLEEERLPK